MQVILKLVELKKDYSEGEITVHVLKGINMEIEKSEFTAIAGPSGSGKTTLLNLVGCLDKPTSGKIFLDGVDMSKYSKKELADIRRQKIGFVFQTFNLIPILTAYENVAFPLSLLGKSANEIDEKVKKILNDVGLSGLEHRYPRELSGGQQQRVAIARALVKEPSIILADEPTGNLDPYHTLDIIQLLLKINQLGTTIILATHNKKIINSLGKRVITLEKGKIIRDEEKGRFIL